MLLHDYLKLKAAILTKAKADIDNLLTEIADPNMKEAVDDWDLGDPITDNYPQVDQEKEAEASDGTFHGPKASTSEVGGPHNPEPSIEVPIPPVAGHPANLAADASVKPEDNTNQPVL